MNKEHPEVKELKNICDTSKTPKQVCEVVKGKDKPQTSTQKKDKKI
jgi:hypothetical protein